MIELIENVAVNLNYYGSITAEELSKLYDCYGDDIEQCAEEICAVFSTQDGDEVGDDFFNALLEIL